MEEQKDKDVDVVPVVGETLAVSEGSLVVDEGCFTGGVGQDDDGGECNGDELMVEVLGSNVYVGGVCTSGDGEKSGDDDVDDDEMVRDELVEVDMGTERNGKSLGGDGAGVGEPGSVATGGDTHVVHVEHDEVVVREDVNSHDVAVSDEKVRDSTPGNGIGVSEATVVVVTESVEVSRRLVEVAEQEKKLVVGGDELNDLKTQKAGVNEEGLNSKPLSEQGQISAVSGDFTGVDKGDTRTSKVAGQESDNSHENSSHLAVVQRVKVELVGGSAHSSSNVAENSVSSSLPAHVFPRGEIAVAGAHDAHDLPSSERDQFLKFEESVENMVHDIALVGSTTLSLPTQAVPGGVVSVSDEGGLLNPENDQHRQPEESIDKNMVHDVRETAERVEMEGVKDQVTDAERVLHGREQIEDKGQDTMGGSAEIAAADDDILLNPNIEVHSSQTDIQVTDIGEITPMDTDDGLNYAPVAETKVVHEVGVTELVTDAELDGLHGGQYMEVEKEGTDSEQPKATEEEIAIQEAMQPGSSEILPQPRYELPPENEGVFSASDLVWGKVKSHPWWPGQIFDYTLASERAMKYHKKDCFLVAYFGDRTFAWNEPSSLKPFRSHFSQAEKQCSSEAFQNAVTCALEEISRRVELGLACSCIPKDVYEKIRFQTVQNAGICQESSKRDEVDESASASTLECNKLLEYVKALAQFPSGDSDRLELVIAKAHLLAFYRLKSYCSLPEFQLCGDLLEDKTDNSLSEDKKIEDTISNGKDDKRTGPDIVYSHKRKHNLRDGVYSKIKERSLAELMDGSVDSMDGDDGLDGKDTGGLGSPSSGKRRKGFEYHADDLTAQDGRKAAKASNAAPTPKQSFKIGECIQRVASQLTGSTMVKSNSDKPAGDGSDVAFQSSGDVLRGRAVAPTEYSSLDELLSQLQSVAEGPQREYHSMSTIVNFFSDFRNSVSVGQHAGSELLSMDKVGSKRKKSSNSGFGSPETFEFDDMNDTYWTDRVIQNGAEEPTPRRGRKVNYQPVVLGQQEKSQQEGRRPYSRKRYSQASNALPPEKPVGYVDENAPTELVMNFSEVNSVPSEAKLNTMFRRFGPLKESETEVDRESSRARVVFKRCSDAEVAFNSAGKFNIFGPIVVNYQLNYTPSQLNYTPSIQFSAFPSATAQDQDMQLVLPSHDHEMHLDLSTHDQMQLDLSAHDQMQLDLSTHDQIQLDLSSHDQMQLDLSTFENLV